MDWDYTSVVQRYVLNGMPNRRLETGLPKYQFVRSSETGKIAEEARTKAERGVMIRVKRPRGVHTRADGYYR